MKEYEEILRKRIYLQRLPSGIDTIINRSIGPIQLLLSNPILNKDRRASLISSCSKTVTQYKFDLMTINLDTIGNIRRGHEELLLHLQKQLFQSDGNELVKQAIEHRQQAMIERHGIYLQHKLQTFSTKLRRQTNNEESPSEQNLYL